MDMFSLGANRPQGICGQLPGCSMHGQENGTSVPQTRFLSFSTQSTTCLSDIPNAHNSVRLPHQTTQEILPGCRLLPNGWALPPPNSLPYDEWVQKCVPKLENIPALQDFEYAHSTFRTRKIQGPFRAWSTQYQVRSVGGHASPSVDTSGFGFCFNPPNFAVLEDEEDVTADDGPLFYNPHSFDAASEAFHLGRPLPDPLTTVAAESSARSSGVSRNTTATSSSDVSKAVQDGCRDELCSQAVDQRHNVQLEDIADLMRRLEENWGRDPQILRLWMFASRVYLYIRSKQEAAHQGTPKRGAMLEPGCESECLAIMQFVEAMEAQANRASGF